MLFLSCKANARVNPLNTKLNPTFHLLALLGAHHILNVSRIRVKLAKSGHGPHLFRIIVFCVVLVIVLCYRLYAVLLLLCCTVNCVALLLFVLSYVLIVCTVPLPPGVNPIAVDKYIISYHKQTQPKVWKRL